MREHQTPGTVGEPDREATLTDTRAVRTRTRGGRVRRPVAAEPVRGDFVLPTTDGQRADALSADLEVALDLLKQAKDVVLVAHIHPDADALGSALALGLGLAR